MIYPIDCTLPNEVLEQIAAQGLDYLPELIRLIVNAAMKAERQQYLGVTPYERSARLAGRESTREGLFLRMENETRTVSVRVNGHLILPRAYFRRKPPPGEAGGPAGRRVGALCGAGPAAARRVIGRSPACRMGVGAV